MKIPWLPKKKDYEFVATFINSKDYKEVAEQFNLNISSGWHRKKNLKIRRYFTVKEIIPGVVG